ncbi:MAG: septum formation protein Maf [Anaerolineales bacterium]|nr:septum formation protein Maf [Anaerolineales bacterium]
MHLILASQSPRRQELIRLLGYPVAVQVADVDESSITHPDPAVNAVETAVLKATTIAARLQNRTARTLIIAADTIVALDQQMLGKPVDAAAAWEMLRALRHRQHEVHTGLVVLDVRSGRMTKRVNTAVVTMRNYTDEEIATYVASGDPLDKAGAYAIQHPLFQPVAALTGCYTAVMGLSICELIRILDGQNIPRQADLTAVAAAHQVAGRYFPCPIYDQLLEKSSETC